MDPPPAVRRFLSRKFVDLFIFDGELANRLLNPNESRAEEAIEALCQLDLLDDIQAQVRTFWEEQARIAGGASTATGLARYKGIVGRLNARLADLRTELSDADSRLDVIARRRNDLEQKIRQHLDADENGREARDKTRLAKAGVDEEVNAAVLEVLTRLRRPESLSGAFTRTLRTMKSHLDRLKLPESTSRQFFTELAEEELCICGRPLSEHERQFILSRAEDFLGNDIMSTLNSLKTDIDRLSDSEAESALTSAVENLGNLRGKARTLATELEQLENQSFSNASEELVAARTELTELDKEAFKLVERRSKLVGPATREDAQLLKQGSEVSNTVSIKAAERRLEAVNREIARITGTVELKAKIKVLEAILTDARETAQRYIRDVLVGSCNEKLRQVLKGDPIQLKTIDKSLVLEGRVSGSAGQNLAVGYTFLAEALHRGTHVFPLIVDSPAGPLDHPVRREVASMVPNLCSQFIALTISTEREGFLDPLEKAANGDVKYITAFRKTPGNSDLLRDLPADSVQTDQAVLIEGRSYFVSFAKESETDNGGTH